MGRKKVIIILILVLLVGIGIGVGVGYSGRKSSTEAIAAQPTDPTQIPSAQQSDPIQAPSIQQVQPNQSSQGSSAETLKSDELVAKIYQCMLDKDAGRNGTELEKWLLSLEGKRIRLTGEIHDLGEWEDRDEVDIWMGKSMITIEIRGDIPRPRNIKAGDEITLEGIVENIYPHRSGRGEAVLIHLERIIK